MAILYCAVENGNNVIYTSSRDKDGRIKEKVLVFDKSEFYYSIYHDDHSYDHVNVGSADVTKAQFVNLKEIVNRFLSTLSNFKCKIIEEDYDSEYNAVVIKAEHLLTRDFWETVGYVTIMISRNKGFELKYEIDNLVFSGKEELEEFCKAFYPFDNPIVERIDPEKEFEEWLDSQK